MQLRRLLLLVVCWNLYGGQSSGQEPQAQVIDLRAAKELLEKNSPSLLRDQQTIAVARSELRGARQLPNPVIQASSESYPLFDSPRPGFANNQELTFSGAQTIEIAGKRRKRTAVAERGIFVAENEFANARRSLLAELKTRFFTALLAKAQLELSRQVAEQFDAIVRVNEERYKQGEVSGLEYARIQAERSRFFSDVVEGELAVANSKAAVAEILGLPVDASFELSGSLTPPLLSEATPEVLAEEARKLRPDLQAQQQRVERESRQVDLQRALAVPDITPLFGYRRNFGANTVVAGVNVPLPLFNRNQGGIGRAQAQLTAQRYELQRTQLQIGREVQQALNTVRAQQRRAIALRDNFVPNARKARDIAQESYRLGALDLVALLDAERSYREIVRAYNQALFDQRIATSQLEAAVGKELTNE